MKLLFIKKKVPHNVGKILLPFEVISFLKKKKKKKKLVF